MRRATDRAAWEINPPQEVSQSRGNMVPLDRADIKRRTACREPPTTPKEVPVTEVVRDRDPAFQNSSKEICPGLTPRPDSILVQALIIIGGPHR